MLIPSPSWNGINPATVSRPALPSPWNANTAGFYYVAAGGTNVGNGHPADPRSTIPLTAAAGSVIVIEGPFTTAQTSPNDFKMPGTEANPVWIISADGEDNTISGAWGIHGDGGYLIIDGFAFDYTVAGKQIEIGVDVLGLCIRNCTLTGSGTVDGTSSANNYSGIVAQSPTGYGNGGNLIFYNCVITLCGNWMYSSGDPDAHGLSINVQFMEDVWVIDCTISYCSGNAVQFGALDSLVDAQNGRRFYISGCTGHHIAQAGFWVKRGNRTVMSESETYALRRDTPSSSNSSGFGGQYGPQDLWIVNCIAHDSQCGVQIASSSANGTTITDGVVTIAGCLFYDIRNENGSTENWRTNMSQNAGVCISAYSGASRVRVINNTLYDYECGIVSPASTMPVDVQGNIFSLRNTLVNGGDLLLTSDPSGNNLLNYNLFQSPYVDNAGTVWTSVASFTKGTGNVQGTPDYVAAGSNFVLDAGSPGEGEGADSAIYAEYLADFGVSIQVDINGLARPQAGGWSIGAFETSGIVINVTTLNATTLTVG